MTLRRRTELKRTGPPVRRTRLKQVSARRRRRDRDYERARADVYERAGGRCEFFPDGRRCPSPCTDSHHLAGRLGPDPHRLSNLVALCRWHHDLAHANPEWARFHGLMVSRHGGAA